MQFAVRRTSRSIAIKEESPCNGAVWLPTIHVDERSVDDPDKLQMQTDWYGRGANHRVVNGHIMRDLPAEGWFIEMSTLEELVAFSNEHGDLVFGRYWRNPDLMALEIYDDYRE